MKGFAVFLLVLMGLQAVVPSSIALKSASNGLAVSVSSSLALLVLTTGEVDATATRRRRWDTGGYYDEGVVPEFWKK